MKKNTNQIIFYLVCALFVFLPFSSWLVSLTGSSAVSLFRDILILGIFFLSLLNLKNTKERTALDYFVLAFLLWGALSFFWREASAFQWLKGFRFTFLPIILFLGLRNLVFDEKQKKTISKIIFGGAIVISLLAILQLLKVNIPLTTNVSSGDGALESVHFVGKSQLIRLQSVLAGPNALGLYLLAIIAYCFGAFKKMNQKLTFLWIFFALIILLSFSRSAVIGLAVAILLAFFFWMKDRFGALKSLAFSLLVVAALTYGGIYALKSTNPTIQNLITHDDSSKLRVKQYERIWQTKGEIGLFGRGSGTAGPSSQYRLDGGENHWTENIYLDLFEELGYIGFLLYLLIIGSIVYYGGKIKDRENRATLLIIVLAFAVTGTFINYYTGQVGILLLWLSAGLYLNGEKNEKKNLN